MPYESQGAPAPSDPWGENRPEEQPASLTDLSLTDCLAQPMPGDDATVDEIAAVANRWQSAILNETHKSALLARRIVYFYEFIDLISKLVTFGTEG